MDIDLGPLSTLTPLGVLTTTALIAGIDILAAYILAAIKGQFSLAFAGAWLISHVAKRVTPIYLLLIGAVGIPVLEIPAIPALFALAVLGVVGYASETFASVRANFSDSTANFDETSIPA